jgi:hypothetical protein
MKTLGVGAEACLRNAVPMAAAGRLPFVLPGLAPLRGRSFGAS